MWIENIRFNKIFESLFSNNKGSKCTVNISSSHIESMYFYKVWFGPPKTSKSAGNFDQFWCTKSDNNKKLSIPIIFHSNYTATMQSIAFWSARNSYYLLLLLANESCMWLCVFMWRKYINYTKCRWFTLQMVTICICMLIRHSLETLVFKSLLVTETQKLSRRNNIAILFSLHNIFNLLIRIQKSRDSIVDLFWWGDSPTWTKQ